MHLLSALVARGTQFEVDGWSDRRAWLRPRGCLAATWQLPGCGPVAASLAATWLLPGCGPAAKDPRASVIMCLSFNSTQG